MYRYYMCGSTLNHTTCSMYVMYVMYVCMSCVCDVYIHSCMWPHVLNNILLCTVTNTLMYLFIFYKFLIYYIIIFYVLFCVITHAELHLYMDGWISLYPTSHLLALKTFTVYCGHNNKFQFKVLIFLFQ